MARERRRLVTTRPARARRRRPRSPPSIASPVASPRPLLGADRVVALAPSRVGAAEDHPLQLVDPVHERLGPGRAPGHVDVDRHELVGALNDRVVGEHPAGGRAGTHRDDPLGLEHLVVHAPHDRRHLDGHPPGEDQQVRLPRRGAHVLGAEPGDVVARADDRHHLDRAAGQPERGGEDRVGAAPAHRLVHRRHHQGLLDVLARGPAPSRSPRRRSRARSCRTRRSVGAGGSSSGASAAELLALHLQSSAPFRHT